MSKSASKKNKVPKISEEEYAKYINALKSGGMGAAPAAREIAGEPEKRTDKNL